MWHALVFSINRITFVGITAAGFLRDVLVNRKVVQLLASRAGVLQILAEQSSAGVCQRAFI